MKVNSYMSSVFKKLDKQKIMEARTENFTCGETRRSHKCVTRGKKKRRNPRAELYAWI